MACLATPRATSTAPSSSFAARCGRACRSRRAARPSAPSSSSAPVTMVSASASGRSAISRARPGRRPAPVRVSSPAHSSSCSGCDCALPWSTPSMSISFPLPANAHWASRPHAAAARRTWPWERLGLVAVLLLAAGLELWHLDRLGTSNAFYAAAVLSMLQNWHAFFFNSLDSTGFVTIDKPPLGFWVQVASARLLGFSGVSILLPEALATVGSVALVYHLVKRAFGGVAGLLAGLMLALVRSAWSSVAITPSTHCWCSPCCSRCGPHSEQPNAVR